MNPERPQAETEDRHGEMLLLVSDSLSGETTTALADAACLSRYHFQRVFEQTVGEPPGALRRRLLLERAAYELRTTKITVTVIALNADYQSLEGFSRTFKTAFGLAPSTYRRAARQIRFLPGASGVHYDPMKRGAMNTLPGGKRNMDLTERLLESDYVTKRRLLECAKLLSDGQLDAPLAFRSRVVRWVEPPRTLRESFIHLCGNGTDKGWMDEMYEAIGWRPADTLYRTIAGNSPAAMLERLEVSATVFREFVRYVQTEGLWDKEWVDKGCEPPHTFAIGTVIEETLSGSIAHRRILETMMEQMGFRLSDMD